LLAGAVLFAKVCCGAQPELDHPQNVQVVPVQLAISLADGSRVIGETTLKSLPLQSEALGKLEIPLDKVRTVKFSADHRSAVVSLQNGDKTQGAVSVATLKLRTLFGSVTIPLDETREIEVRTAKLQALEWDILPFPQDTDWPGSRGEPAVIDEGAITLRGRPVRTKQTYSAPLTVECEFTVDRPLRHLEHAKITIISEGTDPGIHGPDGVVNLVLQQEGAVGNGGHLYLQRPGREPALVSLTNEPFAIRAGKPNQIRVEILADTFRVMLNDQACEPVKVVLPFQRFHIQLSGWLPDTVWHARKISVR